MEYKKKALQKCLLEIEKELKNSIDSERLWEEENAISKIQENPRAFFSFANKKSKVKSQIGPLTAQDGTKQTDPQDIVNILDAQYKSMFSEPRQEYLIENPTEYFKVPSTEISPTLSDISFSEDEMKRALMALKTGSAPGPDGIPSVLLKNARMCWRYP